MKVAVIDIGTNSMRLLICDAKGNEITKRQKYAEVTGMGKGLHKDGNIERETFQRNLDQLIAFNQMAKEQGCQKIIAIGTSALRDSKNKEEFIDMAKKQVGIRVNIIDGDEEAKLGFIGAGNLLDEDGYTLTIDIGGGSTEFVLGFRREEIVFETSLNLGVVRLKKEIPLSDPPSDNQIQNLEQSIENTLKDTIAILKGYNIEKIVALGGTATSISSIIKELEPYDPEVIHQSIIEYIDLVSHYDRLKTMTLRQRQLIKGLLPQRADVIVQGMAIMKTIMDQITFDKVIVSEYDNLEGMVYGMINKGLN